MESFKLKDVITQIRGVSYKPEDLHDHSDDSSVALLRANNIADGRINFDDLLYVDRKKVSQIQLLQQGDILICASSGSKNLVGKAAIIDFNKEITFGAFCKAVRPRSIDDAEYISMYFQSPLYRREISSIAVGININNIRNEHIDALSIKWPNPENRRKIVAVLKRIDSVIRRRYDELQELDKLIKARFVEMFGDVIQNTREWPEYMFSAVATSRLGKMLDAKQQTGKYRFPYLANFNVQWFRFELDNLNEMDFDEDDQLEFELKDGDLIVCEGGEIGRCAVWHNEIQPCYFQKALHRVRCKTDVILPNYLARWFQYNCEHGGFASIEGAKTSIAHLTGAKLKTLQIAVPPIPIQKQFSTFAEQVDKSKVAVQKALEQTQLLFNSLMQQYFG